MIACGECAEGLSCGGGGASNRCGSGACTRKTCAELQAECGFIGNGCDDVVDCGTCASPKTCSAFNRCVNADGETSSSAADAGAHAVADT